MRQNQEHNAWSWSNGSFPQVSRKMGTTCDTSPLIYLEEAKPVVCSGSRNTGPLQYECLKSLNTEHFSGADGMQMIHVGSLLRYPLASTVPRCSMYGKIIYIWANFEVNVARYSIHGASGVVFVGNWQECVTDYNQLTLPQP